MDWEYATNKTPLIAIPTLVPLPYGKEIESTTFNDDFAEEIQNISSEHIFGQRAWPMSSTKLNQEPHRESFNKIISSTAPSRTRDPACAATKGLRTMTFIPSPFIETSLVGKSFEAKQVS
jgi:hypothetical protein